MFSFLEGLGQYRVLLLSVLLIILVSFLDEVTGQEIAMSVFYMAPILLVTWVWGLRAGLLCAVVCTGLWFLNDIYPEYHYSHPMIAVWNAIVRFLFFLMGTFFLARIRDLLVMERELARTDPLTGIANPRTFLLTARSELDRAARYGHPLSLCYLDVDDFKKVNDTCGHERGNEVLQAVARAIHDNLRVNDLVARLGGDEFAILLPETDAAGLEATMLKVRERLEQAMKGSPCSPTFSIGAVTFLKTPVSVDEMLNRADRLMYAVKRAGKNAVRFETA